MTFSNADANVPSKLSHPGPEGFWNVWNMHLFPAIGAMRGALGHLLSVHTSKSVQLNQETVT